MTDYQATIRWQRQADEVFNDNRYSRAHEWAFDGGVVVPASPHIVPLPHVVAENVDPEEAFAAALSSCHMLVFLGIAAKRRYVVDHYTDQAVGTMAENVHGKLVMTRVVLRPDARFSGERQPSRAQIQKMHHQAHSECFIANSVRTEVVTELPAP